VAMVWNLGDCERYCGHCMLLCKQNMVKNLLLDRFTVACDASCKMQQLWLWNTVYFYAEIALFGWCVCNKNCPIQHVYFFHQTNDPMETKTPP